MQIAELANQVKRSLSPQALGALVQHLSEPEPIAIVGMACRFPGGADDPFRFWELVREGQNLVTEVPKERWSLREYFDPTPGVPGKMYTRYGAFLRDVDKFDADFFEISPLDASYLDPQQRLLLEVGWEALEDAGLAKQQIAGSDAGVFWGLFTDDYYDLQYAGTPSAHQSAATGTQRSMAAGRVSYWPSERARNFWRLLFAHLTGPDEALGEGEPCRR